MARPYIGVDLSKDWLDIFHPGRGALRIANDPAALSAWLAGLDPGAMLVFEATSLCDGLLRRLATEAGQPFHRLNPLHGWHFRRSLNLAKTDRVDARMLARFGEERQVDPSPGFEADRAGLAELSGRRDQLKRMETQEKNRLTKTMSEAVRADIQALLADLARRIRGIETAIAAWLDAHPDLARGVRRLETLPGIGRVTSVTLIALMPELGHMDRREAASLAGLAPRARESGTWTGRRFTGEGRRHIRRALYMAAIGAMRATSPFAGFVARLRARHKPGKLIAIAVARKLLTIANALLRDDRDFTKT